MKQTTNQNELTGCTECGAFTNHFEDCPNDLKHINEYAAWCAAGISPELLGAAVPTAAASIVSRGTAKDPGAILADTFRAWRCNDYYIRIAGEPVMVELDTDVTGYSQDIIEVTTVKVHGDCPACFNKRETQDNEYSYERRGYCGEDEFIVCECGAEWPLHHGTPSEYRQAVK